MREDCSLKVLLFPRSTLYTVRTYVLKNYLTLDTVAAEHFMHRVPERSRYK